MRNLPIKLVFDERKFVSHSINLNLSRKPPLQAIYLVILYHFENKKIKNRHLIFTNIKNTKL